MSDIVNKNENLELELEDNTILSNLFGINDRNLSLIEQINQVKIQYRGNKIKISGNKKSIFETILYTRLLSLPSTGDVSCSDKLVRHASQEGVGHDDDDHDNVDKTTNKEDRQQ